MDYGVYLKGEFDSLNTYHEKQQKEIKQLRDKLRRRDIQISRKENKISLQQRIIDKQQEVMAELLQALKELYFQVKLHPDFIYQGTAFAERIEQAIAKAEEDRE